MLLKYSIFYCKPYSRTTVEQPTRSSSVGHEILNNNCTLSPYCIGYSIYIYTVHTYIYIFTYLCMCVYIHAYMTYDVYMTCFFINVKRGGTRSKITTRRQQTGIKGKNRQRVK